MSAPVCLEHPDKPGIPCERCGTFGCSACLEGGRCPKCRESSDARPPDHEDLVGFGPRAGARLIDMMLGYGAGGLGGVIAAIALAVLEAMGVAQSGWLERFDHGFLFNMGSGLTASIFGDTMGTWVCGASVGKLMLGLRVIDQQGQRAGLKASFLRSLLYVVDALFFGLVAKSSMDGSPLLQRVGDKAADTVVVKAKSLPSSVAPSGLRLAIGVVVGLGAHALVLAAFFIGGGL